ncbi:hypothetical protein PPL_03086 [Heterostelium album PN500]|uniref:Uncharacterized protein n=1 Tax=Heterostelium pallidum (strain ATCC 26659 / Pp 5 / PN500) TaxID=670386 RepID=D3B3W5_HETP5|nr:hypothetical protein PPL_03086 [Heterostelium album PN500]EFA84013.1 hypothetical protein PPL_03086 [Heterostelium album PN500]|eukprot:XP_020436130.1 hypothetical protein PPL_03086 [Heterostelium album PN500]
MIKYTKTSDYLARYSNTLHIVIRKKKRTTVSVKELDIEFGVGMRFLSLLKPSDQNSFLPRLYSPTILVGIGFASVILVTPPATLTTGGIGAVGLLLGVGIDFLYSLTRSKNNVETTANNISITTGMPKYDKPTIKITEIYNNFLKATSSNPNANPPTIVANGTKVTREQLNIPDHYTLHVDFGGEGYYIYKQDPNHPKAMGIISGFRSALNINVQTNQSQNTSSSIPYLVRLSTWNDTPTNKFTCDGNYKLPTEYPTCTIGLYDEAEGTYGMAKMLIVHNRPTEINESSSDCIFQSETEIKESSADDF